MLEQMQTEGDFFKKKKQREVAILNIFFGMLIPFGAALAASLSGSGHFAGILAAIVVLLACFGLIWWRIHRTYQVIG